MGLRTDFNRARVYHISEIDKQLIWHSPHVRVVVMFVHKSAWYTFKVLMDVLKVASSEG